MSNDFPLRFRRTTVFGDCGHADDTGITRQYDHDLVGNRDDDCN